MKISLLSIVMLATLVLAGCGGGDVVVTVPPVPSVSHILSDPLLDGDIEVDGGTTIVSQGNTQSVFIGIDPLTLSETRAFLDFPLASIPLGAVISSATLDIVVDSLQPLGASVPVIVDLVSYPQPLASVDFSRVFFATTVITPPITSLDINNHVTVNVTGLMQEAQNRGLSHFQVRLLKGGGGTATGLVQINDTTGVNRATRAPQLTVVYF